MISRLLPTALRCSATGGGAHRSISTGADLAKSPVTLQSARPWHDDGTSNKAVDNAVSMKNLFSRRTVAVFGVPAPFTGTCTNFHVPAYERLADEFRAKGVDEVVCYSYACPYAHFNWAKAMGVAPEKISFLADPTGEFAHEFELAKDYSDTSLMTRSERFSMLVKDGKVSSFQLVQDAGKDAELLLSQV